jgi:hypothetical protein
MNGHLMVIAALPVSPIIIVIAGLVLAAIVAGFSVYLLRGNKKKSPAGGWQPQAQGQPWGQQQAMGGQADAWAQQQAMAGQANAWGQQGQPAQGGWGQPANPWDVQQQQGATPWNSPAGTQPANPWGTPPQQSAAAWNAQPGMPQAPSWDAQAGQQGANAWGQAQGQAAWEPTALPQTQDPWGQQNAAQQGWGMPQQQVPQQQQMPQTAYGASSPAWNQQGFPAQTAQPAADAWANPAAQAQPFQAANAPAAAPWQQQGGFGAGSYPDSDKTVLRPAGQQSGLGMVRVEEGKEPGKIYEVRKEALSIGRSRESDIFLEDLAVSRLHASIVNLGNGNYALKDEGSANGTKVNGQLVPKYQTYPLQEGDRIQLGQTVLVFAKR